MSKEKVIAIAERELGYTENPPRSNRTKYGLAYGLDGYPWCAIFLWWVFREAGEAKAFYGGGKTASCGALMRYFQAQGRWHTTGFQAGDIVILNFSGTKDTEHCGLIAEAHPDGSITTVEGNTTPGLEGSQDNGGSVARKQRYPRNILGAGRPDYAAKTDYEGHWAEEAIRWAIANGILQGYPDGTFRPDEMVSRAQLAAVLHRYHERFGG